MYSDNSYKHLSTINMFVMGLIISLGGFYMGKLFSLLKIIYLGYNLGLYNMISLRILY